MIIKFHRSELSKQSNSYTKVVIVIFCVLVSSCLACQLQKTGSSSNKEDTGSKAKPQQNTLTAQEVLNKTTDAMQAIKTMSMVMKVTSGGGGVSVEINGEGVIEMPDRAYIKMDLAGQSIEILTLSKTETYVKQPGSTKWEPGSADQLGLIGNMNVDVIQQLGITGFANDIKLAGDENVEGVNCYHITFSLDMTKYLAQLGDAGSQLDAATAKGSGELWVGTDDFLTRKFLFNLEASSQGVTINVSTLLTLNKFNEPVEIPSP